MTGTNEIIPKESAITRSNSVPPLSSNSSSSLFYQTPLINHITFSTSSSSFSDSGSSHGRHHSNSPSTSSRGHHHGGHAARDGYAGKVGHACEL
ncbi:MAG: hypothetical protein WA364_12505 [Candidatus Nitrosopolaris sp.]